MTNNTKNMLLMKNGNKIAMSKNNGLPLTTSDFHRIVGDNHIDNIPSPSPFYVYFQEKPATTNIPTGFVATLRRAGYKVRVKHYRWVLMPDKSVCLLHITKLNRKDLVASGHTIFNNGGRTEVDISNKDGVTHSGSSVCSTEDTFRRRVGSYYAAKRALEGFKNK